MKIIAHIVLGMAVLNTITTFICIIIKPKAVLKPEFYILGLHFYILAAILYWQS